MLASSFTYCQLPSLHSKGIFGCKSYSCEWLLMGWVLCKFVWRLQIGLALPLVCQVVYCKGSACIQGKQTGVHHSSKHSAYFWTSKQINSFWREMQVKIESYDEKWINYNVLKVQLPLLWESLGRELGCESTCKNPVLGLYSLPCSPKIDF